MLFCVFRICCCVFASSMAANYSHSVVTVDLGRGLPFGATAAAAEQMANFESS